MSWIQTFTGDQVWPLDERVDPDSLHLEDIAHSLSLICRYNGHVDRFYSVAEHSVLMAKYFDDAGLRQLALWALFHDSGEAYVGDLVRPIKQQIPQFGQVEDRVLAAIATKWELPGVTIPDEVKVADSRILLTERAALMSATRHRWDSYIESLEPLPVRVEGREPYVAKALWLEAYEALR